MRFMLLMIPGGYGTAAPGTMPDTRREFARAASLAQNARERTLLLERAQAQAPNPED